MTGVLSGEPLGGDREPTQGASPCLEDLGLVGEEEAGRAWSVLDTKEYNVVDLLLYSSDSMIVYARGFVGLECIEVRYIVVEACGDASRPLVEAAEWPEVDRASLYRSSGRDCVALYSRPDPPLKARRLLERLGITGRLVVEAYRPADEEEWSFENTQG